MMPRPAKRSSTQSCPKPAKGQSRANEAESPEEEAERHRTLKLSTNNTNGETKDEAIANIVVEGVMMNAAAAHAFSQGKLPTLDATECLGSLQRAADRVSKGGDLSQLEAMLTAQAVALNTIFVNFSLRSCDAQGQDYMERTMRLALRAQNQSRATVESLAVVKNPNTPIFAKQANIAHGPQQINNTMTPNAASDVSRAHASDELGKSKVLEAHVERMDH